MQQLLAALDREGGDDEVAAPAQRLQDISFNAYSPGRTLNLMLIEHAFTAGAKRVELGISGGSWKRPLAAETETLFAEKFRLK